jgi:hypothetical protein
MPKLLVNLNLFPERKDLEMSEKLMGRIENSQAFSSQSGIAQECWNANSMRAITGRQQIAQVPSEFGQFQLSDNSQTQSSDNAHSRQLKTGIEQKVQIPTEQGPKDFGTQHHMRPRLHAGADQQNHHSLAGGASDKSHAHHDAKTPAQKSQPDYLAGNANIEASHDQQMHNHPAETVKAHMPASMYKTDHHYPSLPIPGQPGHESYYNTLQNAHFKNNTLYGTPAHVEGHNVTPLNHEIAIPLHHTKK